MKIKLSIFALLIFLFAIVTVSGQNPIKMTTAAFSERPLENTPHSQTQNSSLASMSTQDFLNLRMPSLHVLLENARRTPQAAYYEKNRDIEERELKSVRRTWMRTIKLNANYSYGYGNMYSQNTSDGSDYPYATLTGRKQNLWNVGAGISLPLDEIFNRRNKVRQQKLRIEQTEFEHDRWYDDLKIKIIDCYTQAIESLSLLQSASESLAMARAQYSISENDFVNGQIDAPTLSRQKTIENQAVREYQQVRKNLTTSLLHLEVLTNTYILTRDEPSQVNQ